jgi:hypothetical protein
MKALGLVLTLAMMGCAAQRDVKPSITRTTASSSDQDAYDRYMATAIANAPPRPTGIPLPQPPANSDARFSLAGQTPYVLRQVERDPEAFQSQLFAFDGEVLTVANLDGVYRVHLFVWDERREVSTSFSAFMRFRPSVAQGDTIRVLGYPRSPGSLSGRVVLEELQLAAIAVYGLTTGRLEYDPKYEPSVAAWQTGALFARK